MKGNRKGWDPGSQPEIKTFSYSNVKQIINQLQLNI